MVDEEVQQDDDTPSSSSKKLIVAGILGMLLISGGGVGAAYYMGSRSTGASVPQTDATVAASSPKDALKDALYVPLDPAFTVNFQDGGSSRFLQVSLQAMTRDPDVAELIQQHMPLIRNNLVLIFSSQSSAQLRSLEGKEKLREATLSGIRAVLEKEAGNGAVEAVYFTSFVMQ